jgi:hypothetical protein
VDRINADLLKTALCQFRSFPTSSNCLIDASKNFKIIFEIKRRASRFFASSPNVEMALKMQTGKLLNTVFNQRSFL